MSNNSGLPIVYFDGVCGLCNHFIDFLVRVDKKNKLLYAPLQGETAIKNLGINPEKELDTVIFQNARGIYIKSGAALRILYTVGGFWKIFIVLLMVPAFVRNFFYDVIASNRYKWFGKKETCRIPTKEERAKFLP
jgi:predicted DCC family thiol-disulfide oxidoreductase YuxK